MEITPEILRKVQLLELKILLEVKRVCEKHNIKFFLVGGTLIGVVRHKGFIPWDDDIDIGMTRDNYEKFCSVAPSEFSDEFFLQTPETDSQYFDYNIARVRLEGTKYIKNHEPVDLKHSGFVIDIFPVDNITDSYLSGFFYYNFFKTLRRVNSIKNNYRFHPKKIHHFFVFYFFYFLCFFIPKNKLNSTLTNYHKKYADYNAKYFFALGSGYPFSKVRHLYTHIAKLDYLPFEGVLMPVPVNYHEYLTEQFTDYMALPPENKRNPKHAVEIDFGNYEKISLEELLLK